MINANQMSSSVQLMPYEKNLIACLDNAHKVISSKVMSQSMRGIYEAERTLNETQTYIN